jgi:hypothetical protein
MRRVIVRYKVKPESAAENVSLIQRVFAQLTDEAPDGIRYATFKLEDGVSFIHVATIDTADDKNPLQAIAAFQQFAQTIKDRCVEPPISMQAEVVGEYRLFAT